jgi:catechol-2,3-dioxygenase
MARRSDNRWEPAVTKPVLHHVNLKTTRLTEMIDWYCKVTGMTVAYQAPVGAWLSNDAANHRIALLAFPWLSDDPAKEGHTGLHHTAFEFPSFEDLFDNYARLRDLAITPVVCLDHGGTTSMYFHDPDENLVELQVDNFGDWAKSKEWMMTSPEFAANPIGVFIDPAAVNEAFRAGRSPAELHAAMMAGQFLPDPLPVIGPPAPKELG